MNTKQFGSIAELKAQYDFMRHGYNVLVPIGDYCPYDLVIEKDGQYCKIQVKSCLKIADGKMKFDLRSRNSDRMKIYSAQDCQVFYLYCVENQSSYLYFNTVESNTNGVYLRLEPPKNGAYSTVKMAKDYEFDLAINQLAAYLNG